MRLGLSVCLLCGCFAGSFPLWGTVEECEEVIQISRADYADRFEGFWLAECIANWTGLTTEMDRIRAPFFTDEDWGRRDEDNIWDASVLSPTFDFYIVRQGKVWAADDDTNIEYMYLHLLDMHATTRLTAEQIRDGWLEHMWSDDFNKSGQNFLWVSNENAYELMVNGVLPPDTSDPDRNPDYEMIDAQLTTELFGLLAPARPEVAVSIAELPILTTARDNARWASEFYVRMHSLALLSDASLPLGDRLVWMAERARQQMPEGSVVAGMYDFVKERYDADRGTEDWEAVRDALYQAYQLDGRDGYRYQEPWDACINFGASLISLFYGYGDLKRTIQIAALAGWDSDNPAATWGGLIGFMLGKQGVIDAFGVGNFSMAYRINGTRRNFPDHTPELDGEDSFSLMAERGLKVVDRIVVEELGGQIDSEEDLWCIPLKP